MVPSGVRRRGEGQCKGRRTKGYYGIIRNHVCETFENGKTLQTLIFHPINKK